MWSSMPRKCLCLSLKIGRHYVGGGRYAIHLEMDWVRQEEGEPICRLGGRCFGMTQGKAFMSL